MSQSRDGSEENRLPLYTYMVELANDQVGLPKIIPSFVVYLTLKEAIIT